MNTFYCRSSILAPQLAIAALITLLSARALAQPCYPSDPTGNNPDNLCPIYPPPGIRSDSFIQGNALPLRSLPTVENPKGRILHNPGGYWNSVYTNDSSRTVSTSQGKTIIIKK